MYREMTCIHKYFHLRLRSLTKIFHVLEKQIDQKSKWSRFRRFHHKVFRGILIAKIYYQFLFILSLDQISFGYVNEPFIISKKYWIKTVFSVLSIIRKLWKRALRWASPEFSHVRKKIIHQHGSCSFHANLF